MSGGSGWVLGKGSEPDGADDQALEQAPRGSGHGTKLLQFKEHLNSVIDQRIGILCSPVWRQGI